MNPLYWPILYILAIVVSNVITAATQPFQLLIFVIPWGSFFIGATFVLRDFVQEHWGRVRAYQAIGIALVLSAITSRQLGDPVVITFASAISFLVSESTDTEIFSRVKASFFKRIWWSGVVSGFFDSGLFVVLGLSPLGAGFIPWSLVPEAILGQYLVKIAMQGLGIAGLKMVRKST